MGSLLTLFSNPLLTPFLTRPLKIYFYCHFGVSEFGNAETIRENQAIRANLRIDFRESGHLRRRNPPPFCGVGAYAIVPGDASGCFAT